MDSENKLTDGYPINWVTRDGIDIYAKDWYVKNPSFVVAIVHGFGEHIHRYEHLGNWFNKENIAVIGFDQRGHGRSKGERGFAPDYESLIDDIDGLISQCIGHYGNTPIVLYGHSMGGNLVLNYLHSRRPSEVKAAIVTSPWIELHQEVPLWKKSLGKIISNVNPKHVQSEEIDVQEISYDPATVESYKNDPLIHHQMGTKLGLALLQKGKDLLSIHEKLYIPLLIMHGEDDHITSPAASKLLSDQWSSDYKLWPTMKHEIHNEIEKQRVLEHTVDWIKKIK